MRITRAIMGMPVVVEIVGADEATYRRAFARFQEVDDRFSTYKRDSEISRINRGDLSLEHASGEMLQMLALAEHEKSRTGGIFDIRTPDGTLDPSGIVKGWAIRDVARMVEHAGYHDYWVEAGGDIQVSGHDEDGAPWRIGIRHPFEKDRLVQVIRLSDGGVATSGTYARGEHLYDPRTGRAADSPFVSLTVIASDVYEADLWATTAFVSGEEGLARLAALPGLEAYAIAHDGIATMTEGWVSYTA
jgi:thiamine biosynthesis lipoprotein